LFLVGELEEGENVAETGEFLLDVEDVAIVVLDFLLLLVSEKVGRDVSSVEAEAVNALDLVVQGLAFLDSDDAVVAHPVVEIGQDSADFFIAVGRDGGHIENGFLSLHGGRARFQLFGDVLDGEIDALLDFGWVKACLDLLVAFLEDGAGEDGSSGGAVSGFVVCLIGNVLDEGGSDVDAFVRQVDCLGDSDAVLGDLG
jgi:hypothetical protein